LDIQNLIKSLTGDDDELILQFFVFFSRFEYALKRAEFVKSVSKSNNTALPDWDRFAKKLENSLVSITDIKFVEAKAYLLKHPPQKQMRRPDNSLEWDDNERNGQSETEYVLRLVKSVRNNLFHGGKYPDKPVSGQVLRNRKLLQACLTILENCLPLNVKVERFFEDLYDE
jgi:hypothetical protein